MVLRESKHSPTFVKKKKKRKLCSVCDPSRERKVCESNCGLALCSSYVQKCTRPGRDSPPRTTFFSWRKDSIVIHIHKVSSVRLCASNLTLLPFGCWMEALTCQTRILNVTHCIFFVEIHTASNLRGHLAGNYICKQRSCSCIVAFQPMGCSVSRYRIHVHVARGQAEFLSWQQL